jgi:hypothetical protein
MNAQISHPQNSCATPEIILDRYVAALGGNQRIKQIRRVPLRKMHENGNGSE